MNRKRLISEILFTNYLMKHLQNSSVRNLSLTVRTVKIFLRCLKKDLIVILTSVKEAALLC